MSFGVGMRALREPSWPDIASGTPLAFGFQYSKLNDQSPDVSLANTPRVDANEAVSTPSTLDVKARPDSPMDYVGYSHSSKRGSDLLFEPGNPVSSKDGKSLPGSPAGNASFHFQNRQQLSEHSNRLELESQAVPIPILPAPPRLQMPSIGTLGMMLEDTSLDIQPSQPQRPTFIAMPTQPSHFGSTTAPTSSTTPYSTSSQATLVSALASAPSTPKTKVGEGMKCLIVDDDLLTRRLMGRMLEVCYFSLISQYSHPHAFCLLPFSGWDALLTLQKMAKSRSRSSSMANVGHLRQLPRKQEGRSNLSSQKTVM